MGEQANIEEFDPNESDTSEPETVRLKHLARINPTKSEISDLDPDTEVSFVALEDFGTDGEIKDTETRALEDVYDGYTYFREGDIAIAKITPSFENGKGAICRGLKNGIGFGTTELHILRPREGVSTEYLWYVLRSKRFVDQGEAAMRGVAGQQRIPGEFVENFQTTNRVYTEQSNIASVLSKKVPELEEAISSKMELVDRLKQRENRALTQILTSGTRECHSIIEPDSMYFDTLPSDWEVTRLKFVLKQIEQGWSPRCKDQQSKKGQWGVLKAGAVNNGRYDPSENKTLLPDTDPREKYRIEQGDVLMNRASGSQDLIGSAAYVQESPDRMLLCDKIYRLHPQKDQVIPEFLSLALQSHQSRAQVRNMISGASGLANNIPQSDLKNLEIALPPISEQQKIVNKARVMRDRTRSCWMLTERSIELFREKKQSLITSMIMGPN